jgi:hypothetical protein
MAYLDIEHFTELLCGPNFVTDNIILIQHKFTVILQIVVINLIQIYIHNLPQLSIHN